MNNLFEVQVLSEEITNKWTISKWIDVYVARQLKMDVEDYQRYLINHFNGIIDDDSCDHRGMIKCTLFYKKEDAEKAVEWAESALVMRELAK